MMVEKRFFSDHCHVVSIDDSCSLVYLNASLNTGPSLQRNRL